MCKPLQFLAQVVALGLREINVISAHPDIKANFLDQQYFESIAGTPEELAGRIRSDEPKWRKVSHDAKVQAE